MSTTCSLQVVRVPLNCSSEFHPSEVDLLFQSNNPKNDGNEKNSNKNYIVQLSLVSC